MDENNFTPWFSDTIVGKGSTFEEWRKLTNGLKMYADSSKVDRAGDSMTGPLAITNTGYVQFPDGTQQFSAASPQLLPHAWVNFNAGGGPGGRAGSSITIRSAHNVASIVKLGLGRFQINFIQPAKNSRYMLVGGGGEDPLGTAPQRRSYVYVHAHEQSTSNVKISVIDASPEEFIDAPLINLVIYATNEPEIVYPGGGVLRIRLVRGWERQLLQVKPQLKRLVPSYWQMYGRLLTTTPADYRYRITDGYGWTSEDITSTSETLILTKESTTTTIDLLSVVAKSNAGDPVKTYDIAKRFTSEGASERSFSEPSVSSNLTVTDLPGSTNPDATYSAQVLTRTSLTATAEFTLTLP
jgi:hypothetical protein